MLMYAPKTVTDLINSKPTAPIHPGLRLDRYVPAGNQEEQKRSLDTVLHDFTAHAKSADLPGLLSRLKWMHATENAESWSRTTATPLTLHLARAGVLENAGLLLHRIHGIPYLPGSSLKGLARAYAETIWAPTQPDPAAAWTTLNEVFGWAEATDFLKDTTPKPWKPARVAKPKHASASGTIIFHDAWPESWPKMTIDIVNCHHKPYYEGQEGKTPAPPGDWDDPEPSYFLALKPGASFTFALSPRRADLDPTLLTLARAWLDGALTHFGFGAKTAGGYGYFRHETIPSDPSSEAANSSWASALTPQDGKAPLRAEREYLLTLVTPAYLAGASQSTDDCTLSSGTVRGLLRYWWRTFYAGRLGPTALRELEAFFWGDTKRGGLIQSVVSPAGVISPEESPPQGYLNYGMAENQRQIAPEGSRWRLRLTTRVPSGISGINAHDVLNQAHAALWCWGYLGGVGSKCRKGYGSFEIQPSSQEDTLDRCLQLAETIRSWAASQTERFPSFLEQTDAPSPPESPSLDARIGPQEWTCKTKEARTVLEFIDQVDPPIIDQAYKAAAKKLPKRDRLALGLPRRGQGAQSSKRHASPIHLHVGRNQDGRIHIRAIAFPSPKLVPGDSAHRDILEEFLEQFGRELRPSLYIPPPPPPPPTYKKIGAGQTRLGTLTLLETGWTIQFDGDERPVMLTPNKHSSSLEPQHEGVKVECYIKAENKFRIEARIEKFLG